MRAPNAEYDGGLNDPDVDQGEAGREIFEFVQALRRAAVSDNKLTVNEIFQVAIEHAPSAAGRILTLVKGGDPIQSDVEMLVHVITRQLGVYDAPQPESESAASEPDAKEPSE